jgi:HK97 family phage portal protein
VTLLRKIQARLAPLFTGQTPGTWWPTVREPYTGAWQLNDPLTTESAFANPSVFGAVSRISQDISKIAPPLLLERDRHGFWTETTNPAYSPVLRRPNHYQTAQQFIEMWVLSKVAWGNTYVLKCRDERTVVNALHILDPARVKVLTAPDGSVYYELQSNELAGMPASSQPIVVPARELIHDRWNCLYHPLCGIAPLSAIAGAIAQAKAIQDNSTTFFAKGARPSGVLIAPTKLDPQSAARLKADAANFKSGEILIAELGMKYESVSTSAVDAQVIEQLGWTEEKICEVLGLPISILNSSKQPPYANAEASQLQYKSQCLEPHLVSIATCLGEGLDLPSYLTIEFDDALLIWMDTTSRVNAAKTAISSGAVSPNEARDEWFGLGPVPGGETPYLQQQNWPLEILAAREPPTVPAAPPPAPTAEPVEEPVDAA